MNQFQSSADLKASAREHLFGHYGTAIGANLAIVCILAFLMLAPLFLADTGTITGTVIYYLLSLMISVFGGLFVSGQCYFYLKISCDYPVTVSDIFYGFKLCPGKALTMQLYITVLCYIAQLPMTIIGYLMNAGDNSSALMLPYSLAIILCYAVQILLSLTYQQAFYLLHDFPQYSAGELLRMSRRLMVGHKGRLFYIYVSFIPLILLSLLSFGIALLWVSPYISATKTEFFLNVIKNSAPEKMYA
jgi:uncharacterized membrane protein